MIETSVIYGFITIFSFGMIILSFLSYGRTKNFKILFVSIVFFLFFIKGILLSLSLFITDINDIISIPFLGLLDLFMIILLFIATLKKQ
jgi:hypothetical protein